MLPLVGFATIAAICTVSAHQLTPSVDNPRIKRSLESMSLTAPHINMRRSDEEFVPMMYPDEGNYELGQYDPDDEVDEETQRSYTEERMGKRSIALGRSGFRPGKRSLPLGRLGFRPGKRSLEEM
ncbi:hypothetical protein OESDEN_23851 [Oesophagostomum dentatum]|uniref:Uncharacterized protein n=1 Tax=Oesophagostomum dentatum TaxID=61180 RepID=A0A0B1RV26_OESDE|nr:hypothetical protein OESDEN_23851 [Oesophagostomum dentatum]